jgi:multidrug efflux pump subunit AcrA (membrane-fusion protein)
MADARDWKPGVLKMLAPISLISVLALAGCADSNGAAQTSRGGSGALERATDNSAVPVVVSKAGRSSFPVELRAIGTGQAFKTVSVQSQVAGIVKEVHYRQGQSIHQGDLLVTRSPGTKRKPNSARPSCSVTANSTSKELSPSSSTSNLWQPRRP